MGLEEEKERGKPKSYRRKDGGNPKLMIRSARKRHDLLLKEWDRRGCHMS